MTVSPSLFIKEPGKTRNVFLASPELKKEAGRLKAGDLLNLKITRNLIQLTSTQSKAVIGEVYDPKIMAKLNFVQSQKGEISVIFVLVRKEGKGEKLTAQFLIKTSLPVFTEEVGSLDLKPYVRPGEVPAEELETETLVTNPEEKEELTEADTNPLSGLTVIDKEDLP